MFDECDHVPCDNTYDDDSPRGEHEDRLDGVVEACVEDRTEPHHVVTPYPVDLHPDVIAQCDSKPWTNIGSFRLSDFFRREPRTAGLDRARRERMMLRSTDRRPRSREVEAVLEARRPRSRYR